MISAPNICRWAGPVIDILLDYVGHVKLCSRLMDHLDSYPDWSIIKEKAGESITVNKGKKLLLLLLLVNMGAIERKLQ